MPESQQVILTTVLSSLSAAAERALEERPLPSELGQRQFRRATVPEGGYDAEKHTVTMAVSSEYPVVRYGGTEVLSHKAGAIRLERLKQGIALLFNHDYDQHLGRSVSYQLADGVLHITNRFGTNPLAREKEQDVADGILTDVSIGYQPLEYDITEDKTGYRTYTVIDWELYENSLVTVPADPTVGVDRSAPGPVNVKVNFRKLEDDDPAGDDEDGDEEDSEDGERSAAPEQVSTTQPTTEQRSSPPMADVNEDLAAKNKERITGLRALRTQYPNNFSETQLMDAISNDTPVTDARTAIADAIIAGAQAHNVRTASDEVLGRMSDKEQKSYSLRNAICATINQRQPGTFKDKGAEGGFEREVSESIVKTLGSRGLPVSTGNIIVPSDLGRRSLQAGGNAGSNTINTTTSGEVIDMLRPRCRVLALGATQITVDTGLLRLPRQTGTSVSQWLAELAGATNSDMTFDSIGFSPKRNGIVGSYTLELLAQSAISVEPRVRADQLASKARTYDAVCTVGTGAAGMPLGLLNMTGLAMILTGATRAADGTVTAGAGGKPVTFVDINNFEAAISTANADTGTMGWMYTPRIRAAMRSTAKFPGTGGFMPLLPDSATGSDGLQEGPLGYKAGITSGTALPTNGSINSVNGLHTMIFGVWENLIIANWGVSELVYDNITGAKQGVFQVIENEFMDLNTTHIEGFAASTTVLAS